MDGTALNTGLKSVLDRPSPVAPEKRKTEFAAQRTTASTEPAEREPQQEGTPAQAIAYANTVAALFDTKLSFNYDERIDQVVVSVKEGSTDEIIRQFPPEEMIELAAKFKANYRGLILNRHG